MSSFKGFEASESFTPIPDSFFRRLLNEIQDADELKVTLYSLWRVDHIEGPFHALCVTDFDIQEVGLRQEEIASGLEKAVLRGSLLKSMHGEEVFFFLNSARGRAAAESFAQGNWRGSANILSQAPMERPNLFKLYEENIGPLTPLMADALKDAEETYPPEWIADAIDLAVKNNKRSWKYAEAILKRWKEEGRDEKQDRRDNQASRQRNVEDKIKKFTNG